MKKCIVTIILMALSTLPTLAQIDIHCHAVTQGYLNYVKANGTEMVKSLKLIDTNPMVGMEMLGR